jgi:hypothetical protein
MTLMLTRDNFLPVLDKLIDANPDYQYQAPADFEGQCIYADPATGAGSCLIGQAVGIIDPDTLAHIREHFNTWNTVDDLVAEEVLAFEDPELLAYASSLQCNQDCDMPWAQARAKAMAGLSARISPARWGLN